MFSAVRMEGGITTCIPGQSALNSAPSQDLLPLWCHCLVPLTGTTQAVFPPPRPSCSLLTCVFPSCLREGKQSRNSVVIDSMLKVQVRLSCLVQLYQL